MLPRPFYGESPVIWLNGDGGTRRSHPERIYCVDLESRTDSLDKLENHFLLSVVTPPSATGEQRLPVTTSTCRCCGSLVSDAPSNAALLSLSSSCLYRIYSLVGQLTLGLFLRRFRASSCTCSVALVRRRPARTPPGSTLPCGSQRCVCEWRCSGRDGPTCMVACLIVAACVPELLVDAAREVPALLQSVHGMCFVCLLCVLNGAY